MRKLLSVGLSAVATGAFVVAVAAPASAAPPWTITPGGNVVGTAGTTTLTDTTRNVTLRCTSSRVTGTLDVGSSADNILGRITGATWTSCTLAGIFTFNVTAQGLPWNLNGNPSTSTASVIQGTITGVRATLSGPACSAVVAGSSATTGGTVNGTFTNATDVLAVNGGNLRIWNVVGCGGLMSSGDSANFQGNYTVTPGQTITP
jgi:hypothetical protein